MTREHFVPRSATRRDIAAQGPLDEPSKPLVDWQEEAAYVLLAEPGAGKTWALEALARAPGCTYIKATALINLQDLAPLQGKTLFIDGFDEARADKVFDQTPAQRLVEQLQKLGRPRFRLSCREADWYGVLDTPAFAAASPSGAVAVLQLDPLTTADVRNLLGKWRSRVPKASVFLNEVKRLGLSDLLRNPLMLDLMVDAMQGEQSRPSSRLQVFEKACEKLVTERNDVHHIARLNGPRSSHQTLLEDAGWLAALLLLANKDAVDVGARVQPCDIAAAELPKREARPSLKREAEALPKEALGTGIFIADGTRRQLRHRSIAEYLAATFIARLVMNEGLPIGRVLALTTGHDGGVVEPLRGLNAWLAACCDTDREALINADPLGVVLYGDVRHFTSAQKMQVLQALAREAERYAGFRGQDWTTAPFGALGSKDMAPVFEMGLRSDCRESGHEALLDCALDAIRHGEEMPQLLPALDALARNASRPQWLRLKSMQASWKQSEEDAARVLTWLHDIQAERIQDPDDELLGWTLNTLCPKDLQPAQALPYLHSPKQQNLLGQYWRFWRLRFLAIASDAQVVAVLDALSTQPKPREAKAVNDLRDHVIGAALVRGLASVGAELPTPQLCQWLGLGLDERGTSRLSQDHTSAVRQWLTAKPQLHRRVLASELERIAAGATNPQRFWHAEALTYRATRPLQWVAWMLAIASKTKSAALAQHCFVGAAKSAANPQPPLQQDIEKIEQWVQAHEAKWPQAREWLKSAWATDTDHWQSELQRSQVQALREEQAESDLRRQHVLAQWSALQQGTASARLLGELALAYEGRFSNIHGATGEARVGHYLSGTVDEVGQALHAIKRSLARTDLPTAKAILELDAKGRYHPIRPACVLAAELVTHDDARAPRAWSDALAQCLLSFEMTGGLNKLPEWFLTLAKTRPPLVAQSLLDFAVPQLRKPVERHMHVVEALVSEPNMAQVAVLAVPKLLRTVPIKAARRHVDLMHRTLLPALLANAPAEVIRDMVETRLRQKHLDANQRITWLLVSVNLGDTRHLETLAQFVGNSQPRAAHLAYALRHLSLKSLAALPFAVQALARLIELIAPHTSAKRRLGGGLVTDRDRQQDLMFEMVNILASSPQPQAAAQLHRLQGLPAMQPWLMALKGAIFGQTRVLRAASLTPATVQQVSLVLRNQAPANATDLAAILLDQLQWLGDYVRHDQATALQLFWNEHPKGELKPKDENKCRDVLMTLLAPRLAPLGIHMDSEQHAAFDKRVDMSASASVGLFRVRLPIEIKTATHRDVWLAWHTQLETLYTTDPACGNLGVYLVLWFGKQTKAPPDVQRPEDAADMRRQLILRMSTEQRQRLSVVVLDLSWPPFAAGYDAARPN